MKSGAQAIPKFDPFNMTGLPDHILPQILDDFYFWYNDYAMRCEFQMLDAYIKKQRAAHTPDPLLKGWLDQGLISQNQYDQVALLRGGPSDVYSDIFAKPIGDIPVVPPDEDVSMFGGVPMVQSGINYTKHYSGKHRSHVPGSMDRLRHHDPIPETNLCPEVHIVEGEHLDGEVDRIMQKSGLLGDNGMLDLFKVAALSKRNVPIEGEVVSPVMDLDENLNRRNYGILIRESLDSEGNVEYHLGEPKEKPLEGQIVDKGVEVRVIPDDYEFPPHVSKPGDGYKLDHIAPLPSAQGIRPLISGTVEMLKGMSQGRGRDETMAIYHEYHAGLEALEEQIAESRSAGKSLLPKPDLTAGEVGEASAELAKIRERTNPLREHWVKHGDPYEGRLPLGDPKLDAIVQDLLQEHSDPELAAKVKQRVMEGLGDLDSNCDADTPPWNPTPEEIADAEEAMQEAAEGKLDYLLEGTQWDPKLRK